MKKWLILTAAIWLACGLICPAGATSTDTITFDDLPTPNDKGAWGVIPDGYMGFDWQYFEGEKFNDYKKTYSNSKAHFPSAPNAAYNGGPEGGYEVVSFSSDHRFVLQGAYFSTWAQNNQFTGFSSRGLIVTGYLDGKMVGSTKVPLTPDFVWQGFNFGLVDQVAFTHQEHDNKHWWLMDNLQVSGVPLPATGGLFCGGLIALYLSGSRHAKRQH